MNEENWVNRLRKLKEGGEREAGEARMGMGKTHSEGQGKEEPNNVSLRLWTAVTTN